MNHQITGMAPQVLSLDVGQGLVHEPPVLILKHFRRLAGHLTRGTGSVEDSIPTGCRKGLLGIQVKQTSHGPLFDVVLALAPPRSFSRSLDGRQQQRHENTNDRNDHEQFDQREARDTICTWPL
jgi:hypothetical protein